MMGKALSGELSCLFDRSCLLKVIISYSELQIREGIEDISKIIFLNENML